MLHAKISYHQTLTHRERTKVWFAVLALKQKLLKSSLPRHTAIYSTLTRSYLRCDRHPTPGTHLLPGPETYQGCFPGGYGSKTGEMSGKVVRRCPACHRPGSSSQAEPDALQRDETYSHVSDLVETDLHIAGSLN